MSTEMKFQASAKTAVPDITADLCKFKTEHCLLHMSYTPPLIALTSQITRVSPKTSIWYTVYTVGFLLAFLFRAPFSGLIFFLLPSQPVDIFRGALLTHPFFILSIFTLLLTSFTHMVSPQAGTNNPQILLFCTSEPCYLSLGSQILQY